MTTVQENHRIRGQKKIAFSYSDPGGTLENKLNNLKPLFSRKKSLTFQKRSKENALALDRKPCRPEYKTTTTEN